MSTSIIGDQPTELQERPPKPRALPVNFDKIPAELKEQKIWCLWRYEFRHGQWTKVPYQPWLNHRAKTNASRTWSRFDQVDYRYTDLSKDGSVDGVGVFIADDLVGVDIDHCISDRKVSPDAQETVCKLRSYAEISPSGTGLRIFAKGSIPGKDRKNGPYEMYDKTSPRFLTITGQAVTNVGIEPRQEALSEVYFKHLHRPQRERTTQQQGTIPADNAHVMEMILASPKYSRLWAADTTAHNGDDSAADLALCGRLAYYGCDEATIDTLFRQSGLYREKWDRRDYRDRTIAKAMETESRFDWTQYQWASSIDAVMASIPPLETTSHKEPQRPFDDPYIFEDRPRSGMTQAVMNRALTFAIGERVNSKRPAWLIKDILRKNSVGILFGESGSGKTWLAMDMGLCVSTGRAFLGRYEVKQGKVFYIISEGADDFEIRAMAWCKQHGIAPPPADYFVYRPGSYDFFDDGSVDQVLMDIGDRIKGADLIIVDTLAKNFMGDGDKNSDMSKFLIMMEKLRDATGATVMPIHHTGWSNTDRERGGRALRDGVDTSIHVEIVKGQKRRSTIRCKKQKMGQTFDDIPINFELVRLPEYDTDDEQVTALVARYDDRVKTESPNRVETLVRAALADGPLNQTDLVVAVCNKWKDHPNEKVIKDLIQDLAARCEVVYTEKGARNATVYSLL